MDDTIDRNMAVFHQICEVNELNPEEIAAEARKRFPDKFKAGQDAERLIWTAFDHRAKELLQDLAPDMDTAAYKIDSDPAAPSFVVNEDRVRSQYDADRAARIIDTLRQVQLPVTG